MNRERMDEALRATLEDHRLSRGEKKALGDLVAEDLHREARAIWRGRAFELAKAALATADAPGERRAILDWLEEVVKLLMREPPTNRGALAEVLFSPGDACRERIASLLRSATESADICVFTITDDRLAGPILQAHLRGVRVRIVSDDGKSQDLGSDVDRLRDAGVPVRVDRSEHHMHHKYAVFDGATLVTGSYNWTRSAAEHNRENVVVTDDPRLVASFQEAFARLWADLED